MGQVNGEKSFMVTESSLMVAESPHSWAFFYMEEMYYDTSFQRVTIHQYSNWDEWMRCNGDMNSHK
eukprot:10440955-Karenia_brevis.AAC.1